jgi:hypothetical protein
MDWFELRNTLLTVAGIWRQFEKIAFFVIRRETRLWFRCVINRARIVESRRLWRFSVGPVHLDRFEMYKEFILPGGPCHHHRDATLRSGIPPQTAPRPMAGSSPGPASFCPTHAIFSCKHRVMQQSEKNRRTTMPAPKPPPIQAPKSTETPKKETPVDFQDWASI